MKPILVCPASISMTDHIHTQWTAQLTRGADSEIAACKHPGNHDTIVHDARGCTVAGVMRQGNRTIYQNPNGSLRPPSSPLPFSSLLFSLLLPCEPFVLTLDSS